MPRAARRTLPGIRDAHMRRAYVSTRNDFQHISAFTPALAHSFPARTDTHGSWPCSTASDISLLSSVSFQAEMEHTTTQQPYNQPASEPASRRKHNHQRKRHTSQVSTFLKMIHSILDIALSKLLGQQARHHSLYPLFAHDRVLGCF